MLINQQGIVLGLGLIEPDEFRRALMTSVETLIIVLRIHNIAKIIVHTYTHTHTHSLLLYQIKPLR